LPSGVRAAETMTTGSEAVAMAVLLKCHARTSGSNHMIFII
jgi:hypothetical protein